MNLTILNLLATKFWDYVFPKGEDGKFHLTEQISSMLIITLALIIILLIVGRKIKKVDYNKKTPKWLVPFVMIVEMINNFTKKNIGKRWKPYASYFTALAIFMVFMNISSIFGLLTPTSYIVINFALALITFFIIQITGIKSLGIKGYLKGYLGPVKPIAFIMVPLNIISELALPLSLTIRLMGNVLSGSVISKLIVGVAGYGAIPVLPVLNFYFDLMSGVIQTFVFVMLSIIFTSNKIDDSEKIYE